VNNLKATNNYDSRNRKLVTVARNGHPASFFYSPRAHGDMVDVRT